MKIRVKPNFYVIINIIGSDDMKLFILFFVTFGMLLYFTKNFKLSIWISVCLISLISHLKDYKKDFRVNIKKIKFKQKKSNKRVVVKCSICESYLRYLDTSCPVCNAPYRKENMKMEEENDSGLYIGEIVNEKILSVSDDELAEYIYQKYGENVDEYQEKNFVPRTYLVKKNVLNIIVYILLVTTFYMTLTSSLYLILPFLIFLVIFEYYNLSYNMYSYINNQLNLYKTENIYEVIKRINNEMVYDNSKKVSLICLIISIIISIIIYFI